MIITWILLDIYQQDFSLIAAFAAGFMSLIPMFNPLMIIIPYCAKFYFTDQIINCVSIFVIISYDRLHISCSRVKHTLMSINNPWISHLISLDWQFFSAT
jgi:hypothetical protein